MSKETKELLPHGSIKLAPRVAAAAKNGAKGATKLEDSVSSAALPTQPQLDPEMVEKIAAIRTKIHETFGKVVLALTATPRYRNLSIGDLSYLILDPLMRDRIAVAQPAKAGGVDAGNLAGIAIWASVSEDVDAKIREQIKAGVFPVRLKPDDWTSGKINWLMDVVAPNAKLTALVIANFRQVIKEGDLRIHPLVSKLVDPEILKKMGAAPLPATSSEKRQS